MMVRAILRVNLVVFLSFLAFLSPSRADGGPETCQVSKEKQLLEEIIRTQLKAEAMLQEIRKTEEHVISVLEYRKQDVQKTLKDFEEDQRDELDKLKTEHTDLQLKVQVLQASTYRAPIIFFIARGMISSYLTNGQTLIFPTTLNNLGSGYNNGTGVFTVPVSGLYQFTVSLCVRDSQAIYLAIVSENDDIMKTRLVDEQGTHNSCGSFSGFANLKKGNKVWVKSPSSLSGNNLWGHDSTFVWNTFAGVLINESH